MNIVKMAFWNLRSNLRDNCPLFLSTTFSILIFLNFLMILFTDVFSNLGELDKGRIDNVISAGSFVLGCFLFFFIWYSTDAFLTEHKEESGIYVFMGLNGKRAGRLYMTETLMTGMAVLAAGSFFGVLTAPLFQMILEAASDIEVEFAFRFAAEPLCITTGVVLSLYAVFAVRGYRNIATSKVFAMVSMSKNRGWIMAGSKGLICRAVPGAGSLIAGYYLSARGGGMERIGMLILSGILVIGGIYQVFGSLIPLLFQWLTDHKQFLYRKERTLWINNAACRMRKNYRTYAMSCVLTLCAVTALAVGFAMKEWYEINAAGSEYGEFEWIKLVFAVITIMSLVFAIAGGSAILMKGYGDALEEKEQYVLLRKMGMSSEILNRVAARELCIVFVCPLILTVLSSYFLISALEKMLLVELWSFRFVSVVLISLFFGLLYLFSVARYRKNVGNR